MTEDQLVKGNALMEEMKVIAKAIDKVDGVIDLHDRKVVFGTSMVVSVKLDTFDENSEKFYVDFPTEPVQFFKDLRKSLIRKRDKLAAKIKAL